MFATMHTTAGDIRFQLFPDQAPKTVKNFTGLADGTKEWKHPQTGLTMTTPLYDGVVFHRVIAGFMIQGGDPLGTGTGGPGYEFDDEITMDLTFGRPYLLAMANAGKRGGKGTNGSQFFVTVGQTPHLNGKHTIFGEVADQAGRDVVDAIAAMRTRAGDRPAEDVVITSVTIEQD